MSADPKFPEGIELAKDDEDGADLRADKFAWGDDDIELVSLGDENAEAKEE